MLTGIVSFAQRNLECRGARMRARGQRSATRGGPYGALLLIAIFLLAVPLSACGKKGNLEPPDGQVDQYPRQYPDPSSL
jgi:hypothetical protein